MRTKDLIDLLRQHDPTGCNEVVIDNRPVHVVDAAPACYDGGLQLIQKNLDGTIHSMKVTNKGTKIRLFSYGVEDAIMDDPDIRVVLDIESHARLDWEELVDKYRQTSRHMWTEIREEEYRFFQNTPIPNRDGVLTYQSKWGFHPCDRVKFMKIKRLNHLCMQARIAVAKWNRWHAQNEKNRGPEPAIPKYLTKIVEYENFSSHNRAALDSVVFRIEEDYKNAKKPKCNRNSVVALKLNESMLDDLLELIE